MSTERIGRAFSPENCLGNPTQGVALGWYGTGPFALEIRQAPRAKGATSSFFRANGASPYQPGASPQEWNRPTKQRAEGPFHGLAGCVIAHHFRDVTKRVPQVITQRNPAAGFYQRTSSQGILDYSNRRRSRVTEDSSATANSAAHGVFSQRSQGNRQGFLDGSNRAEPDANCRGILGSSDTGMERGAALRRVGIGRAFSPRECAFRIPGAMPQAGMALGLWPSKPRSNPRRSRARLPRFALDVRTVRPSSAPTAHLYASLGQRPRTRPRKPHEG